MRHIRVTLMSRGFFRGYSFQPIEHWQIEWIDWCGGGPLDNESGPL